MCKASMNEWVNALGDFAYEFLECAFLFQD